MEIMRSKCEMHLRADLTRGIHQMYASTHKLGALLSNRFEIKLWKTNILCRIVDVNCTNLAVSFVSMS